MTVFSIIRLVTLKLTLAFAIIVLGLCAHITALTNQDFGNYLIFAALGIATAVLTIASVPVMIIVDRLRSGAFTSMVVVELAWLSILWVLWLSSAATAANANQRLFPVGCDFIDPDVNTVCHEFSAVEAFAFLAWIFLMGYTIALLIITIMAGGDGRPVWTSSVKENSKRTGNKADVEKTGTSGLNMTPSVAPQYPPNSTAPQFSAPAQYPPGSVVPGYGDQVPQSIPAPQLPQSSPYPQV